MDDFSEIQFFLRRDGRVRTMRGKRRSAKKKERDSSEVRDALVSVVVLGKPSAPEIPNARSQTFAVQCSCCGEVLFG